MRYFSQKNNEGYTLVETLVAVSIFSVAVLGLLVTLSKGIADTGYAKKKIVAAYLAQEGIEYLRNMRDTYAAYSTGTAQQGWSAFRARFFFNCRANRPCYINADNLDYSDATQPITSITTPTCPRARRGGCPELRYNSTTGKYNYSSGEYSGFTREIVIDGVAGFGGNELRITSTVYWSQGSGEYSVSLTEDLFGWIE